MNLVTVYSVEKQDCLSDEFHKKGGSNYKVFFLNLYLERFDYYHYVEMLNPNFEIFLETIEGAKTSFNYLENGKKYWTSGTDQYCPGRYRSVHFHVHF